MKVEQLARRLMIAQVGLTLLLALGWWWYSGYLDALAVVYGGAVSIVLAWMHKRGVRKAEDRAVRDPKAGMLILYVGAVLRFILLIVLLGLGFGLLKLSPQPMLAGFVLAQLGFLFLARR
ncbi:MAG TPA: ATP synthase subunit I [bacterium]|nr:ATP synthase subunit I [bacterium]